MHRGNRFVRGERRGRRSVVIDIDDASGGVLSRIVHILEALGSAGGAVEGNVCGTGRHILERQVDH